MSTMRILIAEPSSARPVSSEANSDRWSYLELSLSRRSHSCPGSAVLTRSVLLLL